MVNVAAKIFIYNIHQKYKIQEAQLMSAKAKRLISLIAAVCMIIAMVPIAAYAANPGTLTTDIGEKTFVVGVTTEFSFTTTANDDLGKMVRAFASFNDADAVDKLEYYEVKDGNWYEFDGNFGPPSGFPMSDATSKFRITFKKAGDFSFTTTVKEVSTGDELCSVTETFSVRDYKKGELSTDIDEQTFVVGKVTEFTFTTTANDDLGKMVIGTSNFSDADAIEKLEYYEVNDGKWYEFKGDFGPSTGFPMSDATSKFRITFKEAGDYTFTASMKEVATGDELCSVNVSFTVSAEDETDPTTPVEPTTPEDPTAPEDPTTPDEPTTPDQPTAPADDTTVPVDDTAPADDTAPVDDTTAPADDSADSDKPQTGDSSNLAFWIVLLVISAGGLAAVIFFERKYKLF